MLLFSTFVVQIFFNITLLILHSCQTIKDTSYKNLKIQANVAPLS